MLQIENEYGNIEESYGQKGKDYVKWAAKMAVGLGVGVPWVMCEQADAPEYIMPAMDTIVMVLNLTPTKNQYFGQKIGMDGREAEEVEPILDALPNLEQKLETESKGVNYTSIRPVYIYDPLNYTVEEWFFHRLKAGRLIPIPNSGLQVSQLGHIKVLATASI
ncbi:putative glycoside hydrolase, family 35, glycoside hydrolase superfamily [Helianthus annuus]|nr:putative glycoside hydrolase, family 35, glycoside hydrolase superfamily [Helianthus annuus]